MAGQLVTKGRNGSQVASSGGPKTKLTEFVEYFNGEAIMARVKQVMTTGLKHNPERFLKLLHLAATKSPKIAECDKMTVLMSVMEAAARGHEIGRDAYLVPFRNKGRMECQYIPSWQGLIKSARNSGQIADIWANVVREGDLFEYEEGLHRDIRHKPNPNCTGNEPLLYAYACAKMKDGSTTFVVLPKWEVERARAVSRGADYEGSPWKVWPDRMWMKTAIRRLYSFLPSSDEMQKVIDADNGEGEHFKPAFQDDPESNFVDTTFVEVPAEEQSGSGDEESLASQESPENSGPEGRPDESDELLVLGQKCSLTAEMLRRAAVYLEKKEVSSYSKMSAKTRSKLIDQLKSGEHGYIQVEEWVSQV